MAESGDLDIRLLAQLLEEVQTIRDRLGEGASQSSVQISTSARGHDVQVKCYVGSPVREAGDSAISEYVRVVRELQLQLMDGMEKTVKALRG